MNLMSDIADRLKDITWKYDGQLRQPELLAYPEDWDSGGLPSWPMSKELRTLLEATSSEPDKPKLLKEVGKHIWGVVASTNELIAGKFKLRPSGNDDYDQRVEDYDQRVKDHLRGVRDFCLRQQEKESPNSVLQTPDALQFAQRFLRIAALYHDIGKIIGNDRHVSRGVHLMRDVNDGDRIAFEQDLMSGGFEDKHNFWTLLSHHDIFGCLCTGEASLPALSQMVSWSGNGDNGDPHKSPAALLSYLVLLNIADGDSSLCFVSALKGLRTVEAKRYLEDWRIVKALLWDDTSRRPKELSQVGFREGLLDTASHPERTIERIARMITTSYRMVVADDLMHDESEVKTLVEDELGMLHGPRLQMFCYLFARFCKIDYGRRFFDWIMRFELLDGGLLTRTDKLPEYEPPNPKLVFPMAGLSNDDRNRRRSACLKQMTRRVCGILKRFVDDYGSSVAGDSRGAPLMCIVMANLMPENNPKTAWAICRALKAHESRALAWISEEVAVSPYGG